MARSRSARAQPARSARSKSSSSVRAYGRAPVMSGRMARHQARHVLGASARPGRRPRRPGRANTWLLMALSVMQRHDVQQAVVAHRRMRGDAARVAQQAAMVQQHALGLAGAAEVNTCMAKPITGRDVHVPARWGIGVTAFPCSRRGPRRSRMLRPARRARRRTASARAGSAAGSAPAAFPRRRCAVPAGEGRRRPASAPSAARAPARTNAAAGRPTKSPRRTPAVRSQPAMPATRAASSP